MSNIIGIGGSIHDFATCLFAGNQLIAIEDERLTRVRYAANSPDPCQPSIQYCLKEAGIDLEDVDEIVGNDELLQVISRKLRARTTFINHHLSHAYSTFFTSPFEEAAILVVDGAGSKLFPKDKPYERETTTYALGRRNEVSVIGRVTGNLLGHNPLTKAPTLMSNSIGELYRAFTESIGFGWLQAGKTMGLASYGLAAGDDRFVPDLMTCIKLLPEGQFKVAINGKRGLIEKLHQIRSKFYVKEDKFRINAAIAWAGQIILEALMLHALEYLSSVTETTNLCLAGGVALNSLANGKIPSRTRFRNVHVVFAPGDSGTAIGAAIWGALNRSNSRSDLLRVHSGPFLGRLYSSTEMKSAIDAGGLSYTIPSNLHEQVAQLLERGLIVAWYQGGSEFGPRALGNRSILADPKRPEIRDFINHSIKYREWFRPLAPAVTLPAEMVYFDSLCPSQWMQFVWPVRDEYHHLLPSITHVDGSARIQSVDMRENENFYRLIEEFGKIGGVPILLNTSFNIRGEPIIETPREAVETFQKVPIDALAMGEFLVVKDRANLLPRARYAL